MRRLANRAVCAVLRSRAHPVLSWALLLLTYRGRRTGKRFTIPLLYARDGGDLLLVALHPEDQLWWRSLEGGADVELLLAGERLHGRAEVERPGAAAGGTYAAARPWARPALHRAPGARYVRVSPRA